MEVAGREITKYGIALLGIVLVGVFLRVYHLGTQSLWLDEGASVAFAKLSVPQMVQATAQDVHPPFYYLILHYWIMIFGTSESAVRLLSALFEILAIPMIYVVGRQLFNKEAGLVAALILALSSFNIYYSQEARMYSLMVLLALLSMYFFWRFLQQSSLVLSVGYILSTTLLVWTHTYSWFVVIAENIYVVTLLVLSKDRTYRLRDWAVLQAIVVALFVPWMAVLIVQISQHIATASFLAAPTIITLIDTGLSYSGTGVLSVLFLALSVLSVFGYHKVHGSMDWKAPLKALKAYSWEVRSQDARPLYFLAVLLLVINLIPFVISHFSTPIYLARYTIAASAALYLLAAKGTSNLHFRPAKVAVVAIIVVLSVANLQVFYASVLKPDGRDATAFVDANASSGDVVLISPSYHEQVFDYYNSRTDFAVKPIQSWAVTDKPTNYYATPSVNRPEDKIKEVQSNVTGHERVWFFDASYEGAKVADNFTLAILNQSYANVYVKSFYGYDVYLFEKRA